MKRTPENKEALIRTVSAITHDITKRPGQIYATEQEKLDATMDMLALVVAEVLFLNTKSRTASLGLLDQLRDRVDADTEQLWDAWAKKKRDVLFGPKPNNMHEYESRCPHCHKKFDVATGLSGDAKPRDGDATICASCGELGIFDAKAPYRARKPTKSEHAQFNSDPMVGAALSAFKEVLAKQKGLKP